MDLTKKEIKALTFYLFVKHAIDCFPFAIDEKIAMPDFLEKYRYDATFEKYVEEYFDWFIRNGLFNNYGASGKTYVDINLFNYILDPKENIFFIPLMKKGKKIFNRLKSMSKAEKIAALKNENENENI